jgi:AraC family transcriptional regulator of adaptative response/methylated-DNA-[protein]-cysteine methyltransferase
MKSAVRENAEIRYAVTRCSLGAILVAASEKGVCAILLGDQPASLVQNLQERFPKSRLAVADGKFDRTVAK